MSSGRSILVSVKGSRMLLESILADIQSGKQQEIISDKFYLRIGRREIQDKTTIFDILSTIAMSLLDENNGGNGLLDGGSRLGARLLEIAESDSA